MHYSDFGSTGIKISRLGFGAMRLPEYMKNGRWYIREDETIEMMRYAFGQGVNYIDTAFMYNHGNSESVVGKALKGWRDRVCVSTKLPLHMVKSGDDFDRLFETQMKRLDVDKIDFYHLHSVDKDKYENVIKKFNLMDKMSSVKEENLIGHISFSFHDKPEVLKELIDTGFFETMLVQYNMIDRANEDMLKYAKEKGLGTVVMSPVGGGRLSVPAQMAGNTNRPEFENMPELALRFVLSNPDVDCMLSGMGDMDMVRQNIETVSEGRTIDESERKLIEDYAKEIDSLLDIFCTECGYCMPCPNDVNIPICFRSLIYHEVFGLTEMAEGFYEQIGNTPWFPGKNASACKECGECEQLCPQDIKIIDQLKQTAALFSKEK